MSERMSERKESFEDEEESPNSEPIENEIQAIKNECAHVYDDLDNAEMLDQLIKDAREFFEVNPSGWETLLSTTKKQLREVEEPEKIEDILRAALTEGTTELM